MAESAALPRKLVDKKNLILKSRLDPQMIWQLGERLKKRSFAKFGLLKPKSQYIRMIYDGKYYEPYIIIGGKYALDYCKKHVFTVEVDDRAQEIFINGKKSKSEFLKSEKPSKIIKLDGEEYSHHEVETYFIFDRLGREVSTGDFPFAPFEEQKDDLEEIGINLRNVEISLEKEIELLRSRIGARPSDVAEVIREIFDINERIVIHYPKYQLTFQNIKTGKESIAIVDGITGEVIFGKFDKTISGRILCDYIEGPPLDRSPFVDSRAKTGMVNKKQESSSAADAAGSTKGDINDLDKALNYEPPVFREPDAKEKLKFPAKVIGEIFDVGDNLVVVFGDLEIPSGTKVTDTLAVKGNLRIGDDCHILGKLKASKDIIIGANTKIEESLVSGHNVILGLNSIIHGSVEAEEIEIDDNAVIEGVCIRTDQSE